MQKSIRRWLIFIVVLITLMVALGGITRLTGSGLSITEWKPIMGAIPPLNEAEWAIAFEKYKEIPQYRKINSTMTLSGFKWIFFWEYTHRLLGRVIGLAFALPLALFWIRKKIPPGYKPKLLALFFLGGSQGAMGWFMVMSGLSELTYVSHIRLMLHLMLAFIIGAYAAWLIKSLSDRDFRAPVLKRVRTLSRTLFAFVFFQCVYGALTAGLKAGYQYPTFPTFNGEWIPNALWDLAPSPLNFVSNPVAVQWTHRLLGTLTLGIALAFAWKVKNLSKLTRYSSGQKLAAFLPFFLVLLQYTFGAFLVWNGIPIWLGVSHQVLGFVVFLAALNAVYEFNVRAHDQ